VAPSVEWAMSHAFVDFNNTQATPSYAVWSLDSGWTVNDRVSLFLDLRNLADKAYVSNAQPVIAGGPAVAALWPGDGRSVNAGLTVDF
jgi:iron complex outermembrane receptor protein